MHDKGELPDLIVDASARHPVRRFEYGLDALLAGLEVRRAESAVTGPG